MRDLEQTDELPALPTGTLRIRGSHYDHRGDYRHAARTLFTAPPASVLQQMHATARVVLELDRIAKQPRSPLFQAALALLRQDADQLATLRRLADAFPHATLAEVCQVLRETAVLFHAAGVVPKAGP